MTPDEKPPLNPLYTVEEVAAALRTTPGALYTARWRGTGPVGVKRGSRVLFRLTDFEEHLARLKEPPR